MQNAYVVTGTLTDKQTVVLDEAVPVSNGRVRIVIEPETVESTPPATKSPREVMEMIWERQRLRGFVPPTREEVDAYLKAERDSWDDD